MIETCQHPRLTEAAAQILLPPPADFVRRDSSYAEASIVERFERQVELYPDRIAVKSPRAQLTYQELNSKANQIARMIVEQCGPAPAPVALLMEKDALHFAAILGVLKAGKIYVPLAPTAPHLRNAAIIAQAEAAMLLTDSVHEQTARELVAGLPPVVNVASIGSGGNESNLQLYASPDSPALIIFTSGSTGEPKGAVLSHRAILHNIQNYTNDLLLRSRDRLICLGSCAFSGILKDVYGALLNGATLLPLDVPTTGLGHLAQYCRQERVTVFDCVPTLFRAWIETLDDSEQFPDVRVVRLGGEAVISSDVERFRHHFGPHCVLVNGYGPTESGTVTLWVMGQDDPVEFGAVPIGISCDDCELRLLNESGNEVQPGEIGQIAVRSRFLATGYWRRQDLTDAVFRADPAGGDRPIYLTGDLAWQRPDGCLVFAGRNDFQLKIRGYRVESGAVEAALRQVADVRDAAVVGHKTRKGKTQLVAYVVPREGAVVPTANELRALLRKQLPDYAVPSAFVSLPQLPLNGNGKLDRRALPFHSPSRARCHAPFTEPRTEIEKQLAAIWQDELCVDSIGTFDDFFELGGDSLTATGLMAHIHKVFGRSLPISVLAEGATIAHLAKILQADEQAAPVNSLVTLQPCGSKPPFFCVHGLGGEVLFLSKLAHLMGPEQPFYAFRMQGLNSDEAPYTRIESMAAHYVEELLRFQPHGPYYLGGFSLGGTVAFEMAQQLRARRREVALLVIVDQRNLKSDLNRRLNFRSLGLLLGNIPWWIWDDLCSNSASQMWQRLRAKFGFAIRRLASLVTSGRRKQLRVADVFDVTRLSERYRRLVEANFQACRSYVPRPYLGRIVLIRARAQALFRLQDLDMGWGHLAREGIEIRTVSGHHDNLHKEPHVNEFAGQLLECINNAVDVYRS